MTLDPARPLPDWYLDEPDTDGPLPDVPEWLASSPPASELADPGSCPHCTETDPEPVRWDVPGVWASDASGTLRPPCSSAMSALAEAVEAVVAVDPSDRAVDEALVDLDLLLLLEQRLRRHKLRGLQDLRVRHLYALDNEPSTRSWLNRRHPETHVPDVTMSDKLRRYPFLRQKVLDGEVTMRGARQVIRSLESARREVDRPDGLIDGQDSSQVIQAVVGNTVDLVSQAVLGIPDADDPALLALVEAVRAIQVSNDSELGKLEQAFTVLAQQLPAQLVASSLSQQVDALLPLHLEERAEDVEKARGLTLYDDPAQPGGRITIDADAELWELAHLVLAAESRRDPANPTDTVIAADLRELVQDEEEQDWALLEGVHQPRTRKQRLHDALKLAFQRYLDAGLAGTHDKAPVLMTVTVPSTRVEGTPGSLPGRGGSGKTLPVSLIRRWWCHARVTALVMAAGWIPLGASHTQRTITALERKASTVQHGGRCAGLGCCRAGDPLVHLVPHHVEPWSVHGTTSLGATIMACQKLHHDIHVGHTVQLRNGRWLNENGWSEEPVRGWTSGKPRGTAPA